MNETSSAGGTGQPSGSFPASSRKIVAQSPEVQVKEYLLAPGEQVPWHHHSVVFDVFYCLEGRLTVQRTDVASRRKLEDIVLRQGESAKVEPGTAHCPTNREQANCRFLLVQGGGRYDFLRFTPAAA